MNRNDLESIAREILELALEDKWRPNSHQIRKAYRLKDHHVKPVKDLVKRFGAAQGVMWGWDPGPSGSRGFFRVCPHNDTNVGQRMLAYARRSAAANVNSMGLMLTGAVRSGVLSINEYNESQIRSFRAQMEINEIGVMSDEKVSA